MRFAPVYIRPHLHSSMFIFIQLLFVYIIISLNKCPLGECDSPLQYFRIIPLTSLSGHIQLDEYIMGECDSPLHWHIYIYYSNPVRANRIRPYIGTYIYYSNPVRANRIRPNQHSPNIFSDNINDKNENSVAFTQKYLGFSPRKTWSFG